MYTEKSIRLNTVRPEIVQRFDSIANPFSGENQDILLSTDVENVAASDARFYQAAQALIDRHEMGVPIYIEAFDVPHQALLTISKRLEEFGVAQFISDDFVIVLKNYIIRKGGSFARIANAQPIFIAAEVSDHMPDFRFEDGVTEMVAVDKSSVTIQKNSKSETQAMSYGDTMPYKLWIRFESPPKSASSEFLTQEQVALTAIVEAVGAGMGSEMLKDLLLRIEQDDLTSPAVMKLFDSLIEMRSLAETGHVLDSELQTQGTLLDSVKKFITQSSFSPALIECALQAFASLNNTHDFLSMDLNLGGLSQEIIAVDAALGLETAESIAIENKTILPFEQEIGADVISDNLSEISLSPNTIEFSETDALKTSEPQVFEPLEQGLNLESTMIASALMEDVDIDPLVLQSVPETDPNIIIDAAVTEPSNAVQSNASDETQDVSDKTPDTVPNTVTNEPVTEAVASDTTALASPSELASTSQEANIPVQDTNPDISSDVKQESASVDTANQSVSDTIPNPVSNAVAAETVMVNNQAPELVVPEPSASEPLRSSQDVSVSDTNATIQTPSNIADQTVSDKTPDTVPNTVANEAAAAVVASDKSAPASPSEPASTSQDINIPVQGTNPDISSDAKQERSSVATANQSVSDTIQNAAVTAVVASDNIQKQDSPAPMSPSDPSNPSQEANTSSPNTPVQSPSNGEDQPFSDKSANAAEIFTAVSHPQDMEESVVPEREVPVANVINLEEYGSTNSVENNPASSIREDFNVSSAPVIEDENIAITPPTQALSPEEAMRQHPQGCPCCDDRDAVTIKESQADFAPQNQDVANNVGNTYEPMETNPKGTEAPELVHAESCGCASCTEGGGGLMGAAAEFDAYPSESQPRQRQSTHNQFARKM
jgi:hypothetical protein